MLQCSSNCFIQYPLLTTSSKPRTKPSWLLIIFEIIPFCHLILGRFSSCILFDLLTVNQLAGFYIRETLALNGLKPHHSHTSCRRSHLKVILGKGVLKICSKCTGEHPCQSTIIQLYRNRTSAWMFSCKFAACFQDTFS